MRPIVPPAGAPGADFFEIGLGQEQYGVLPGYVDRDGLTMTEWEPTPEERAAIAAGGRVRLWIHTCGQPLQPVSMEAVHG